MRIQVYLELFRIRVRISRRLFVIRLSKLGEILDDHVLFLWILRKFERIRKKGKTTTKKICKTNKFCPLGCSKELLNNAKKCGKNSVQSFAERVVEPKNKRLASEHLTNTHYCMSFSFYGGRGKSFY
jgi:hypothetical protein